MDLTFTAKPFKAQGKAGTSDNPMMSTYFSVDFCMILAIVLSLLALLFTYDACSSEREQGTLKQVLANSIPRSSVLMGKVLGACFTLMPIILFCYLLCALAIVISPEVAFSADDWLRMGLVLLASILFFSTFAFLGLFVSSMFRHSAASIIVCLLAWVFFLFVVPDVSGYVTGSLLETPSEKALAANTYEFTREQWREADKFRGEQPRDAFDWEYNRRTAGGAIETSGATPAYLEWYRQGNKAVYTHMIESSETRWLLEKEFLDKQDRQRLLAERLSMVSPSQVFQLLCNSLCRTDVTSYKRFIFSTHSYREELIQYLRNENLYDSYRFFTAVDPEKMPTKDEYYNYRTEGRLKTEAEFKQWCKENPGMRWETLYTRDEPSIDRASLPLLDLSVVPPYKGVPDGVAISLKDSLVKLAILVCVCVILFYLSFIAFLRYDVR